MANRNAENREAGGKRIDAATGTETVGHEWDGIEELDTPMPRWWLWTLYLTIVWGIAYVILYPAWPLIDRATVGVLEWSSRGELAEDMRLADLETQTFREQLAAIDVVKLQDNPELLRQAIAGGRAAFQINCSQCHGSGAAGSQTLGYPNLNDDAWLWGGDLKSIHYTIEHGIRQPTENEERQSIMPPFEGVFEAAQLEALVGHVQSLGNDQASHPVGAQLYADNCASCHGPSGQGSRELGAPNLSDAIWLRGGSAAEIRAQILNPKMGVMPGWKERLDEATVKMLTAYVWSLGGGERISEDAADPAVRTDVEP